MQTTLLLVAIPKYFHEMTRISRHIIPFVFFTAFSATTYSQEKDFEQLALSQKTAITLPLDYKISRPRLEFPLWDKDFDIYYSFLTPALRKTQAALSMEDNGVVSSFTPNSIMPHAQLDTTTIIANGNDLPGTWRMLVFRSIRFNDSVDIATKTYYRLADTLLDDKTTDEAFAIFSDNQFKLYVKEAGRSGFKKEISSKYKIENKRFLMLYKFAKAAAGISQFGVDEKGYLILNYPKVIENVKKGVYFSYYSVVEQYVFEKVK